MTKLPTGTVTFLFTDVQDNTRLWERHPEAMRTALSRHDALLRETIERNRGHVVKHRGDGLYAVLATATQAVEAAVAAQMALHTGSAEERDGDYFGPVLNRAARLLDAGHGRQILISSATAQLIRGELPAVLELHDLGEHRLKGLTRAERIYQLVGPGLPLDIAPLVTLSTRPNNLPIQFTTFLGREHDISSVRQLLEHS